MPDVFTKAEMEALKLMLRIQIANGSRGADRRREVRSIEYAPIRFIAVEKGPEILKGGIVNLSDDGMTIFSYVPLYMGRRNPR